jgi:hypothetical protein
MVQVQGTRLPSTQVRACVMSMQSFGRDSGQSPVQAPFVQI